MGIITGICIDVIRDNITYEQYIEVAHAEEIVEPREVRIEIIYSEEGIERLIRETFPEDSETAVKIARCENGWSKTRGYDVDIQSKYYWRGERERSFGIFQIHYDSWHNTAVRLGYDNYQTDVLDNLHMARYIYDNAGKTWRDWSCYTKKMI